MVQPGAGPMSLNGSNPAGPAALHSTSASVRGPGSWVSGVAVWPQVFGSRIDPVFTLQRRMIAGGPTLTDS